VLEIIEQFLLDRGLFNARLDVSDLVS
jgi:hypothetical protein